jgi:hypothetical protein
LAFVARIAAPDVEAGSFCLKKLDVMREQAIETSAEIRALRRANTSIHQPIAQRRIVEYSDLTLVLNWCHLLFQHQQHRA